MILGMLRPGEVGGFMAEDCPSITNRVEVYSLLAGAGGLPLGDASSCRLWRSICGEIMQTSVREEGTCLLVQGDQDCYKPDYADQERARGGYLSSGAR
jgi:hypothetical protein